VDPAVAAAAGVAPLVGNSTATNTPDLGGTTFNFTGSATGGVAPITYSWDFGDTNTSTIQNPTHTYANPNTYSVTLTVTDACTTAAADSSISIVVS
jgi:PKD repeat protein